METQEKVLTAEELQAKLLKKMRRMDLIRTVACVLVALIVVISALVLIPRINSLLDQADTLMGQTNAMVAKLNTVTDELTQVDFAGIAEDVQALTEQGSGSLVEVTEELSNVMIGIQKVDFDSLAASIENLNSIVGPMAKIFGKK